MTSLSLFLSFPLFLPLGATRLLVILRSVRGTPLPGRARRRYADRFLSPRLKWRENPPTAPKEIYIYIYIYKIYA